MGALFTNPSVFFSDAGSGISSAASGAYQNFNLIGQDISGIIGSSSISNPSSVTPMNFTDSLIAGAASTGESVLKSIFGVPNVPSGASYLSTTSPNGATTTELINNGSAITSLGLGSSIMPLLLIGGLGLILVMALSKH